MKKILIIDDESDIRFLLKRALISNNYSVKEAENLRTAFKLSGRSFFDIIILDINLPDGNGLQYLYKLKNNKNIVILISADNEHLIGNFKAVNADGFLKKPFTTSELLIAIDKAQKEYSPIIKTGL